MIEDYLKRRQSFNPSFVVGNMCQPVSFVNLVFRINTWSVLQTLMLEMISIQHWPHCQNKVKYLCLRKDQTLGKDIINIPSESFTEDLKQGVETADFFANYQGHKINIFVNTHLAYLQSEFSKNYKENNPFNILIIN